MTDTLTHDLPLADTLDEDRLRQVFPDAPADLAVPRDVSSLFRARLKTAGGSSRGPLLVVWAGLLVGGLVAALAFAQPFGWLLVALAVVILVVLAIVAHGQASDDFFNRYAAARGLVHVEDSHVAADVPLLRQGDERKWPRVLSGTIAGQPASIAHYTYTDVSHDSEGKRTETDHDFTTIRLHLPDEVAARYAGVYLAPKTLGFGKLQDALAHDRKVELESAEFAKRYTLRVVDSQDDIALYELFSTTFIHALATELTVYWQQRGGDLVVWRKGHETEAADLDRMCLDACRVLQRYCEEWR